MIDYLLCPADPSVSRPVILQRSTGSSASGVSSSWGAKWRKRSSAVRQQLKRVRLPIVEPDLVRWKGAPGSQAIHPPKIHLYLEIHV